MLSAGCYLDGVHHHIGWELLNWKRIALFLQVYVLFIDWKPFSQAKTVGKNGSRKKFSCIYFKHLLFNIILCYKSMEWIQSFIYISIFIQSTMLCDELEMIQS